MPNSIAVLALDAADSRLIDDFNCGNLKLAQSQVLETDAWSTEKPSTKEVWPSVATGVTPDVHGWVFEEMDAGDGPAGKANPGAKTWISLASAFSSIIPGRIKEWAKEVYIDEANQALKRIDHDHCFDEVYMWPGITSATHLSKSHGAMSQAQRGEITHEELRQRTIELTLDEVEWLVTRESKIVGVHSHILDVAGHVYAKREEHLKQYYERMDALVEWVRYECDELVILSDHGMQVGWYDDDEPGEHTFGAFISATSGLDGLPDTIYEVREWLEGQELSGYDVSTVASSDTTEEQLRALGYID